MTQSPSGVSLYLRIETYVIARFNIFDLRLERRTFECSQNACVSDNCVVWVKKRTSNSPTEACAMEWFLRKIRVDFTQVGAKL